MMKVTRIDERDVQRGLNKMLRAGKNLSPVFRALKKPFKTSIKQEARAMRGPDGGWAKRKDSTKNRDRFKKTTTRKKTGKSKTSRRRKGRILGRMPNANFLQPGRKSFKATSKIAWSGVHQDGGKVGKGAILPKRTFLWFTEGFLSVTERAVAQHLVDEGWARR